MIPGSSEKTAPSPAIQTIAPTGTSPRWRPSVAGSSRASLTSRTSLAVEKRVALIAELVEKTAPMVAAQSPARPSASSPTRAKATSFLSAICASGSSICEARVTAT